MTLDPGGAIAQLGERLLCKQEVVGSIPSGSTSGFEFVQEVIRFAAIERLIGSSPPRDI
jgi:hypothetical protein